MKNTENDMARGFASCTDDGGCQVIDFTAYKTEHPYAQHSSAYESDDETYEVIIFMPSNSNSHGGPFDAA